MENQPSKPNPIEAAESIFNYLERRGWGHGKAMVQELDIVRIINGTFRENAPEINHDYGRSGVELIAKERRRQIEEKGWTPEHDDTHTNGALAMEASRWASEDTRILSYEDGLCGSRMHRQSKPRLRQLVIAGALIAAEIERLQRVAMAEDSASYPGDDNRGSR